jgi:hypothetical protein
MIALWLLGCAEDPALAWARDWKVAHYQTAVLEAPESTTTSGPTARVVGESAAGCDAEPTEEAFLDIGFDLSVEATGDNWYVEVHPCSGEGVCDAVPWMFGGSQDLGAQGGTSKFAGSRFVAAVSGGGACTLDWLTLTIGGTPEAPDLSLLTEQVSLGLPEGDATDCTDQLEVVTDRDCMGIYTLSGEAW